MSFSMIIMKKYQTLKWGVRALLNCAHQNSYIVDTAPCNACLYSSSSPEETSETAPKSMVPYKQEGISKAMKAYLERAEAHDAFMVEEERAFAVGKRHLANIMGENPETFSQEDINKAIEYLLPSGLFEPRVRPFMKPPIEVFPKRKAAEFDEAGRPFHSLFYTGRPAYYQLLQEISLKAEKLEKIFEALREEKSEPAPKLNLADSTWVTKEQFETIIIEVIKDEQYAFFTKSMLRLLQHPCSYMEKEFLLTYRKPILLAKKDIVEELRYTDAGVPLMTAVGRRKTSNATVTVYGHGTGNVQINGKNILYFENPQEREQVLFPLQFTNLLSKIDFEAKVEGGGPSSQAGAVRYALSLALRSFVDANMVERMRIAGLLTLDIRSHERKKPGQKGARAKFTWKKR